MALLGIRSCRMPTCFCRSWAAKKVVPVRFPPGRLRRRTRPSSTGSPPTQNTMGIVVVVAALASFAGRPPSAAMTVTRRRTNSSASAGSSAYCCVERYSIVTLRPSMRPPSLNPWRKAATELMPEVSRIPMTGSDACCARPMTGHAPAPPTSVMNSRRLMCVLTSARGEHPTTLRCRVVQHSKVDRRMVEMGHKPRRRWGPGASLCPQCLQSR